MIAYDDRNQQRNVCETMAGLLNPLKAYCDANTRACIETALWILLSTPCAAVEIKEAENDEDSN